MGSVTKSVRRSPVVYLIRTRYREVPNLVRMDAGFFDQQLMRELEMLGVGYLIGGKLYGDVLEAGETVEASDWSTYTNDHQGHAGRGADITSRLTFTT